MPLQPPNLDDRDYERLKREALLRIPRYAPEWTDFNESDPGIALVDLFAWLTEMMLYRLNQVPERAYLKFLELLKLQPDPPQPARATLIFKPRDGADVQPVPKGAPIAAQPPASSTAQPGNGQPLIFETTAGLDLVRLPLAKLQVFDGGGFTDVTAANDATPADYWPFGWLPQVGNALYLGFGPATPATRQPFFPPVMRLHAFLPLRDQAGQPVTCPDGRVMPAAPATLTWEYRKRGPQRHWQRLNTFQDGSIAFTREGYLQVEGPPEADIEPTVEGVVSEPLYWVRVRISGGTYPAGVAPRLACLAPNAVEAENLTTVRSEPLGASDASPNQVFALRQRPVVAATLVVTVQEDGAEAADTWTQRPDFLASMPDDPHYIVDAPAGRVQFGDGRHGRIPTARALITAEAYRYGGGQAGNVGPGAINAPQTNLVGIDSVTNQRPAVGGRDEQDFEEFRQQAPAKLRAVTRAVSAEDFVALAGQVGGVARATALPLFHPDHPGVEVPGAMTVVVVPDTLDRPPAPSQAQLDAVCNYLNERRLLTTELYVKGPEFFAVRVEARVAANPYAAFGTVEQDVSAAVNAFLDPLAGASRLKPKPPTGPSDGKGGGQAAVGQAAAQHGSDFGQDLFPTHLYSVILGVPDVRDVRYLAVTVNGQPWDLQMRVTIPRDGMVYGVDDHDISVEPYADQ